MRNASLFQTFFVSKIENKQKWLKSLAFLFCTITFLTVYILLFVQPRSGVCVYSKSHTAVCVFCYRMSQAAVRVPCSQEQRSGVFSQKKKKTTTAACALLRGPNSGGCVFFSFLTRATQRRVFSFSKSATAVCLRIRTATLRCVVVYEPRCKVDGVKMFQVIS